ncbi:hypothetical protein TraAM80_00603 [Trypanosoma rangeli]|uniref:Uncharacterized protein n=1 Tax=Trypanosoma rangeli TaxID=5698 RepID=A0A3R7NUE3_TRYRA|nr:uncharacterized protein TraAM80_00603 [Trypanosoma rangeli]RNF11908.1 hypothetical protein TraAM80_00603 [Trypanosoma rangeli]|eukprot:RNF11908.1 hypothetical protein TraAM80_00603 [Trypanosoma rangeli]
MAFNGFADENKSLRTKVLVLERELKRRTDECTKLRGELREFGELKQKNESQRELILALRDQIEFLRTAHASAVETLEKKANEDRDREHRERLQSINARLGIEVCQTNRLPKKFAPEVSASGGLVPTSDGAQVVLKSSDISSLGFAPVQRPVDFLGGRQNPLQQSENAGSGGAEEDEAARLMEMVKDEALLDVQYAEVADQEEKELRERFEALRRR